MPETRLREVHLPELHLPEMSREDIVRVIGDARRDADLSRLDPRRIDLSEIDLPEIDLPRIDLSRIDIPKAIATAVQAAGVVRAVRRPRLPFVVGGLIALTIVGVAIASSPPVRPRLTALARRARQRLDDIRSTATEGGVADSIEAPASVAVSIEPEAYLDAETLSAETVGVDAVIETVDGSVEEATPA